MPEPMLFDVKQACTQLGGISRMTLHRLTQAGELKPVRIGSRIMYRSEDLAAFANSRLAQ